MNLTKPKTCLEFGTSLGIASSYIALGAAPGKLTTIEGDPVLASLACKLFAEQNIKNITALDSTFESFLKNDLPKTENFDFIFLDGNHKSIPLINYYQALKSHFTRDTIMMVDDIYWSADMQKGWKTLITMPEVTQSVDCFRFGLLFFNNDFINKEHHPIRLPLI